MADYTNIQRVVIRKPVSPKDMVKAFVLLQAVKMNLDAIIHADSIGMMTPSMLKYKMDQNDEKYTEIAHLLGFHSFEDMKYFWDNFKDL